MTNAEQAARWNGASGRFWAAHDERYAAMLAGLTDRLLAATGVGPGDRVLDVGCGCGHTTRLAARRAADVVGVDLSEPMLDRARRGAERDGLTNVRFVRADAQSDPLPGGLDVVQSQLGVMFFADPDAAFANLRWALRPGGLLAFVCWQELGRNEHRLVERAALGRHVTLPPPVVGGPGPYSLADPDRVRALLTGVGFRSVSVEDVRAPLRTGADAGDAADFVCRDPRIATLLAEAGPAVAAAAREDLRAALAGHETPAGVMLDSAAWLVTAT